METIYQDPLTYSSQREIRISIINLLYAMESFDYSVSLESIVDNFNRGFESDISLDGPIFQKTAAIIAERNELDQAIRPLLSNWTLDRIGCVTLLIIRLALWELKNTDTPGSVVINEAVELAKYFAEPDSYKFINGILDKWVSENKLIQ